MTDPLSPSAANPAPETAASATADDLGYLPMPKTIDAPPAVRAPAAADIAAPATQPIPVWDERPVPSRATPRQLGTKRSPWGVWWLSLLTFGIYYCIWYYKINKELALFAPHAVHVKPGWAVVAQFVPIAYWVSLAHTARRVNAAHASIGSPVQASAALAVLSSFWYASQTRYLQRRVNALWDAAATLHANGR